jgi:hypothetical protein
MPAPVISGVSPAPGAALGPQTSLAFTVTSGTGLLRVFVSITFPGMGITEVVHDGTAYSPPYQPVSTRTAVSGGFAYQFRRNPAWPDAPTFNVYAEDTAGLETVASFAYTLLAPPPLPSPGSTVPVFPVPGPASQVSVVKHNQAYFLAVYDRIMSSTWLLPLKQNSNSGYEILQAYAKIGERLSTAVANLEQGSIIMFAAGGSLSTATVEFQRPDATHGDVTMAKGTRVTTSNGGRDFITTQDAVFTGSAVGPIGVTASAVAPGWQWNVKGVVITARGETLPGEIDTIKSFIQIAPSDPTRTPTFIDPSITVVQIVDAQGGADPMLDGLGADRGIVRNTGEPDPAYALRIRTLPDTISPDAVLRALSSFFAPYGDTGTFIETFEPTYQTCFDMPSGVSLPSGGVDLDTVFTYDDPRPPVPFMNRWLDDVEFRGAFIVVAPNFVTLTEFGSPYDDVATGQGNVFTPPPVNGERAIAAYDVTDAVNALGVLPWCWDGTDAKKNAAYASLWQLLQSIKAAGVAAILELSSQ